MRIKNRNEAFEHSFSQIYATGITTMITLDELVKSYKEVIRKDLVASGINASDDEIKAYLSKTYIGLKQLKKRHDPKMKLSFQ